MSYVWTVGICVIVFQLNSYTNVEVELFIRFLLSSQTSHRISDVPALTVGNKMAGSHIA